MTVAVLYKFVLVVIGIFMLLFGYHPLKNYLGSYMWLFYLGLLLNTVLVIFLLIVMFGPKLFHNIVTGVERFCVRFHLLKHSEERIEKLSGFAEKYRETVQFLPDIRENRGGHIIYGAAKMQCIFPDLSCISWLSFKGHRCAYSHDAPGIRLYRRGYAAIAGGTGNYGADV